MRVFENRKYNSYRKPIRSGLLRRIVAVLICLWLPALSLIAGSVHIQVLPDRGKRQINIGDRFRLVIEVTDIDGDVPRPNNIPGAKLLYFDRTSMSSSFTSVNGATRQSSSATYTATLKAEKEGSFSYGPVNIGGTKSNVARYNIGKEMPAEASPGGGTAEQTADPSDKPRFIGKGDDNLFLKASVSSTKVYEQQAIVYTVKLYSTYDAIKFIGATASPKFDGFVVEESKDISSSLTFETYNGKSYATAVIARYIIFPQMTGKLKVTGNTYTISVDKRQYLQHSFFGTMSYATPMQLNVSPNDLTVEVMPLPEPKPAGFSGAVGSFALTSKLQGDSFKTNQAASVVYTITGQGNIKYAQMPDLATLFPPQLEVYSPTSTQNVKVEGPTVAGTVKYDYSFMPLEEGVFEIPDVRFIYFNPATGKYETSVAKGYTLNVGKGNEGSASSRRRMKFDPQLQQIKSGTALQPWIYNWGYWLFYIVPVILLAGGVLGRSRYKAIHSDLALFNSRRADKMARRRLKKAAAAMRRKDTEAFYNELLAALWGYLADKLNIPTSELMRDNIRQILTGKEIPEETIEELIRSIDDAEFAKYSSSAGSVGMKAAYEQAVLTINHLEEGFKNMKK